MKKLAQYLFIALMAVASLGIADDKDGTETYAKIQMDELRLDLYIKVNCPYCQKVIRYLNKAGIAVNLKDLKRDLTLRDELLAIAGKTQVPCLVINGDPMFESGDIIHWFQENIQTLPD